MNVGIDVSPLVQTGAGTARQGTALDVTYSTKEALPASMVVVPK